jgi:hypothetical protein
MIATNIPSHNTTIAPHEEREMDDSIFAYCKDPDWGYRKIRKTTGIAKLIVVMGCDQS